MSNLIVNFANAYGTSQDQTRYVYLKDLRPEGMSEEKIRAIAKNNFLCSKALDFKSQTPVKNWREWISQTENPEDAKRIVNWEEKLNVREVCEEALYHMYKWGGCLVLILSESKQGLFYSINLEEPIDLEKEEVTELTLVPYFHIKNLSVQEDISQKDYLDPLHFTLKNGTKIHYSRTLVFKMANTIDKEFRASNSLRSFFGFSLFEPLESLIQLVEAGNNTLLDLSMDSQRMVYKIQDLEMKAEQAGGREKVNQQVADCEFRSGNKLGITLGSGDEVQVVEKNIIGNLELQKDNYLRLAGALGLPELLAFGKTLTGLSQNAKEYLDIYFTPIAEFQNTRLRRFLKPLDELMLAELGLRQEDHSYNWCPLFDLSAKEKEEIKSLQLDNLQKAFNLGAIGYADIAKEVRSLEIFENEVQGSDFQKQFSFQEAIEKLRQEEEIPTVKDKGKNEKKSWTFSFKKRGNL